MGCKSTISVKGLTRCFVLATPQGAFRLHYYRTFGGVRPAQAFLDPASGGLMRPLAEAEHLTDAQLEAAAARLGLIRQRAQPPPDSGTRKRPYAASLLPLSCDEGACTRVIIRTLFVRRA